MGERLPVEQLSYADAAAELEQILRLVEADRLDVDQLAAACERAALLVERCRALIERAKERIDAVIPTDNE